MSRWKWICHEGATLHDIGVNADGTLHNPNGYPAGTVHAAIAAATERRHQRRSKAATKAAETRRRRHGKRVYTTAQRIATGEACGPREDCIICGRGLDDPQSIQRGIGSECWQRVLGAITTATPAPGRTLAP
jgi:hypothetical protein